MSCNSTWCATTAFPHKTGANRFKSLSRKSKGRKMFFFTRKMERGRLKREKCAKLRLRLYCWVWCVCSLWSVESRRAEGNTIQDVYRNAAQRGNTFWLSVKWSLLAKHLRKAAEKSCSSEMRTSCCFSNELSPALSLDRETDLGTTWHGGAPAVINGDKSDQRSGNPINRLSISSYIRLIITPAYVCLTSLESMLWDDEQTADKVLKAETELIRH